MKDATRIPPGTRFSPTPGCIIMILVVVVLGGSLVYSIYRGVEMNREIDKFTEKEPVDYPALVPSPEEKAVLREKLFAFSSAAEAGRPAELTLSAKDFNHLIASEPLLRSFRGNTRVVEIRSDFMIANVSQQLNSLLPGRPRYLNATFHLKPDIVAEQVGFSLIDISAAGKEIPRGFVELYAQKRIFQIDPKNETLGPAVSKVRSLGTGNGSVIISTVQ